MKKELLGMAKAVEMAISSLPFEERGIELCMGADGTPTSKIDKVAEDAILAYMDKNDVKLNVLSEEAGFIDRGAILTLVADPIDGTINASRGIPIYSVSLAIGKSSLADLEEGLVYNLVNGDAFYSARGKGAYLNDKRVRVSSRDKKGLVLMAYTGSNASPRTFEVLRKFKRVRCLGAASLDICAVASGQAEAFFLDYQPMERSLRVIDIAAAVLMLREAGGEAYDGNLQILEMPFTLKKRTNMVAVGQRKLLEAFR